jgi:mannosyltransferase OCH1-like enzyme
VNSKKTINFWKLQGFETKLWSKSEAENILEDFPMYKTTYAKLKRNVQKADFLRYILILRFGGFYMDLDCVPAGSVSLKTLLSKKAVYFVEHVSSNSWCLQTVELYPIRERVPELSTRIANYSFGAIPGHESLDIILEKIKERINQFPDIVGDPDYYVLFTTGPPAVTRALSENNYSFVQKQEADSIIFHKCAGSWRCGKDARAGTLYC